MLNLRSQSRCSLATVALALGLLIALPAAARAAKIEKSTFRSGGAERTYYLAAPKQVDPGEPLPLVILLHGSGHDGRSLVEKWDDLARKERFLAVGPDARTPEYWGAPQDGPEMLRDLVEHLRASYPIDPRRIYLFGHSAGAVFALQMGLFESQYFAAVAVHAGALRDGVETWLPAQAKRKIPFHIAVGTEDAYFPLPQVRATRDALVQADFPVELVEMPRHDHWYYDLAPRINEAAWQFLSRHALEGEPVYEEHPFG